MDAEDLPNRRQRRFKKKITVSLSPAASDVAQRLQERGKNVAELVRPDVEKKLLTVKFKG